MATVIFKPQPAEGFLVDQVFRLRNNCQKGIWTLNTNAESGFLKEGKNPLILSMIILGYTEFYGNFQNADGQTIPREWLQLLFVPISKHPQLSSRMLYTTLIKSRGLTNFNLYIQTLAAQGLSPHQVVTTTSFGSFSTKATTGESVTPYCLEFELSETTSEVLGLVESLMQEEPDFIKAAVEQFPEVGTFVPVFDSPEENAKWRKEVFGESAAYILSPSDGGADELLLPASSESI